MNALDSLCLERLVEAAFPVSSAEGLRALLRDRPEVVAVRRALMAGELTTGEVAAFVRATLRRLSPGKKLTEEVAVAAVAVALESLPGKFAVEFLENLAALRVQELPLAPRVAALALARRKETIVESTERSEAIAEAPSESTGATEFEPTRFDARTTDEDSLRLAS